MKKKDKKLKHPVKQGPEQSSTSGVDGDKQEAGESAGMSAVYRDTSSASIDITLCSQDTNKGEPRTTKFVEDLLVETTVEAERETKDWSSLFMDNRNSEAGAKLQHVHVPSGPKVIMEAKDVQDVDKSFGCALIGYVASKSTGKQAIFGCCAKWLGMKKVIFHMSGWVVVKFENDAARAKVLAEGPYYISDEPFLLKVIPNLFNFSDYEKRKVLVWVQLPNLPLDLWNPRALSRIGSMIGIPICTDKLTRTMDRICYARILVELDVAAELLQEITVQCPNGATFQQEIVYEYLPSFCEGCESIGHTQGSCPRRKTAENIAVRKQQVNANSKTTVVATVGGSGAGKTGMNSKVKEAGTGQTEKGGAVAGKQSRTENTVHKKTQKATGSAVNLQAQDSGKEVVKEQSGQQISELLDQNISDKWRDELLAEQRFRARFAKASKEVEELEQLASDDVQTQQNLIIKRQRRDKLAAAIRWVEESRAEFGIAIPEVDSSTMNVAEQNANKLFVKEQADLISL